jgi:hypothetical protein
VNENAIIGCIILAIGIGAFGRYLAMGMEAIGEGIAELAPDNEPEQREDSYTFIAGNKAIVCVDNGSLMGFQKREMGEQWNIVALYEIAVGVAIGSYAENDPPYEIVVGTYNTEEDADAALQDIYEHTP